MSQEKAGFYTPKTGKTWGRLKPGMRRLRHESTRAEDVLWARIRNRQIAGLKFRRQHAIDRFVVDFYCAEASLVIEVDGSIHGSTHDQDALRQEILENMGPRILRVSNDDVLRDSDSVIESIRKEQDPDHISPLHAVETGRG